MRAIVAAAGLLLLAGSAIAGRPTAHTLRKSARGPIEAIAENNGVAAWFTAGNKTCNVVHVLSPGKHDRTMPQPLSVSTTCGHDLSDGQSQLAVASRMSTGLWTLHQSGPQPFDDVLAASFGGPERTVGSLHHTNDGTGQWLGGVAGAGRTLAYSWADVEYVDPSGCLGGTGSCRQKIADGGIRLVTKNSVTPLPGAEPALQLATSSGRIAYIPATIVHGDRPAATTNASLPIVDAATGEVLGQPKVHGIPIAIALSSHVLAVLTTLAGPHERISWFSATDGTKLGSVLVAANTTPLLAASDQLIVYRDGRLLRDVSTHGKRVGKLVPTGLNCVGLALAHGRLIWAENHNGTGRLRALTVG
ncbi:MAG TPA: hypothetical protein VH279_13970 [Solirubrobacteraceae bacterium]|nr:hypothetical protein [Solirubrobacteraceae bacterium]